MPDRGYSDRVNHALAFAAKHHDQEVRKGTRPPYLTRPANIAVILTRYGRDETTVVAGILHDVIEDGLREGQSRDSLVSRIADKFGVEVLETVLQVARRLMDAAGVEMSADESRLDRLERLRMAGDAARWVCAAGTLHDAGSLLADLARTEYPEHVWARANDSPERVARWYCRVHETLREAGFNAPIMDELADTTNALERASQAAPLR
ncbi:MAG TPA: HD domain-containing protein [Gemmatimonadaceae bacterium]|nr:HD domain-containing protein [Gemmatimonadaceae bacterium]